MFATRPLLHGCPYRRRPLRAQLPVSATLGDLIGQAARFLQKLGSTEAAPHETVTAPETVTAAAPAVAEDGDVVLQIGESFPLSDTGLPADENLAAAADVILVGPTGYDVALVSGKNNISDAMSSTSQASFHVKVSWPTDVKMTEERLRDTFLKFGAVDNAVLAKRAGEPRHGVVSFVEEDSLLAALGIHALDGVWFTVSRCGRKMYLEEASAGTAEDLAAVTSVLERLGGRASISTLGVALTDVPLTGFSSLRSFLRSHPTLFSYDMRSDVVVLESSSSETVMAVAPAVVEDGDVALQNGASVPLTNAAISDAGLPVDNDLAAVADVLKRLGGRAYLGNLGVALIDADIRITGFSRLGDFFRAHPALFTVIPVGSTGYDVALVSENDQGGEAALQTVITASPPTVTEAIPENLAVVISVLERLGGRASLYTLRSALKDSPLTSFSNLPSFLRSYPTLFSFETTDRGDHVDAENVVYSGATLSPIDSGTPLDAVITILRRFGGKANADFIGQVLSDAGVKIKIGKLVRANSTILALRETQENGVNADVLLLEPSSQNSGFTEQEAVVASESILEPPAAAAQPASTVTTATTAAAQSSSLVALSLSSPVPDVQTLAWLGDRACLLYIALLGTENGLTAQQMNKIATRLLSNASLARLPSSADGSPSATEREARIGRAVAASRQSLLANLDHILGETDPVLHAVLNATFSSIK